MTYTLLKKYEKGFGDFPHYFENEDGDLVEIFQRKQQTGEDSFVVKTYISDRWIRTNIYWEDGTIEELYEKI